MWKQVKGKGHPAPGWGCGAAPGCGAHRDAVPVAKGHSPKTALGDKGMA